MRGKNGSDTRLLESDRYDDEFIRPPQALQHDTGGGSGADARTAVSLPLLTISSPGYAGHIEHCAAVFRHRALKENQQQFERVAPHDLPPAAQSTIAGDRLKQAIRQTRRVACNGVVFIDLMDSRRSTTSTATQGTNCFRPVQAYDGVARRYLGPPWW